MFFLPVRPLFIAFLDLLLLADCLVPTITNATPIVVDDSSFMLCAEIIPARMLIAPIYSVIYDLVLLPVDDVILLVVASSWLLLIPRAVGSVCVPDFKVAIALLGCAVLVV